jgi:hypothetical protein
MTGSFAHTKSIDALLLWGLSMGEVPEQKIFEYFSIKKSILPY